MIDCLMSVELLRIQDLWLRGTLGFYYLLFRFNTYYSMHYRIIKGHFKNVAMGAIHIGESHYRVASPKGVRNGHELSIDLNGHQLSVWGEVSQFYSKSVFIKHRLCWTDRQERYGLTANHAISDIALVWFLWGHVALCANATLAIWLRSVHCVH